MENSDTTTLYCSSDGLFVPGLKIHFPNTLNLQETIIDFMLNDELADPIPTNRSPANIVIKQVSETKQGIVEKFSYPQLKRIYRGPNPGQSYNHSAIRFYPMSGSTLWLSERISDKSNYFSNMVRPLVSHAAATNGSGLVHSALISANDQGFLLAGPSCSGKSSLALFSMLANAKTVSDDLVLLAKDGECFHGKGFRSCFMARSATFNRLPEEIQQQAITVNIDGETKHMLPRDRLKNHSINRSIINAVVFPCIDTKYVNTKKSYQLKAIEKSSALSRLLSCLDTTVLMPGLDKERTRVTQLLVSMTRQLPCFEVTMTPKFLQDPANNTAKLIDEMLSFVD